MPLEGLDTVCFFFFVRALFAGFSLLTGLYHLDRGGRRDKLVGSYTQLTARGAAC